MTDSLQVTVLGRTMPVSSPNAAQLAIMARAAKVATAAGHRLDRQEEAGAEFDSDTFMTGLVATAQALDVMQALFQNETDRDWLTEQLVAGTLDVPDLMAAFAPEEKPAEKKAVASKTRVRRA